MEAYARAMKDAGSRCEVVGFDGVGHGFFNVRGGNDKNFRETLRLADQFLVSLGYLPATSAGDTPASAPARTRERNRKR
jgi:acetyl esterase/lipase